MVGRGLYSCSHWSTAAHQGVACPSGQVAPDARIRLGRRGPRTVVHKAIEQLSLPYDPASRRLSGVPIVATVSQAAGVRHVLAVDAVATRWVSGCSGRRTPTTPASPRNLIRATCEGRFGTSVLSPLGVVSCDLTP
jgi:hypothetical protein